MNLSANAFEKKNIGFIKLCVMWGVDLWQIPQCRPVARKIFLHFLGDTTSWWSMALREETRPCFLIHVNRFFFLVVIVTCKYAVVTCNADDSRHLSDQKRESVVSSFSLTLANTTCEAIICIDLVSITNRIKKWGFCDKNIKSAIYQFSYVWFSDVNEISKPFDRKDLGNFCMFFYPLYCWILFPNCPPRASLWKLLYAHISSNQTSAKLTRSCNTQIMIRKIILR